MIWLLQLAGLKTAVLSQLAAIREKSNSGMLSNADKFDVWEAMITE